MLSDANKLHLTLLNEIAQIIPQHQLRNVKMSADLPGLPRCSTTKSEHVFEVLDQDFLPVVTSFLSSPQVNPASHCVLLSVY